MRDHEICKQHIMLIIVGLSGGLRERRRIMCVVPGVEEEGSNTAHQATRTLRYSVDVVLTPCSHGAQPQPSPSCTIPLHVSC